MWEAILDDLMSKEFNQRLIKVIAKAKGQLSQREFAAGLGVSSSAVQKWLSGAGFPDSDNLEKIAKAAGFQGLDSLRAYLRGEPEPSTDKAPRLAEEILPLIEEMSKDERKRLMKMLIDLD